MRAKAAWARILPRGLFGLAHDHVQPNAELDLAALARGAVAHVGNLLAHLGGRLAPCEIGIDLLGRKLVRGGRRAAEPHRRIRLLHRRKQQLRALHAQVPPFVVERLAVVAARKNLAPDADELGRLLVAGCMVEVDAVAFELGLVPAGDQVHQQAAAREPVEGRGHARGQAGLVQAGPHRHQKLELLRRADQARCD
jgi:hypothetical protein